MQSNFEKLSKIEYYHQDKEGKFNLLIAVDGKFYQQISCDTAAIRDQIQKEIQDSMKEQGAIALPPYV